MEKLIKKKYTKAVNGMIVLTELYDKNGNIIFSKNIDGYEQSWKYDKNNLITEYSDSDGYNVSYTYKEITCGVVECNSSYGEKFIIKYDEHGNEIYHHDTSIDYIIWKEYDSKNRVISCRDSDGYVSVHEYDRKGNNVYQQHRSKIDEDVSYEVFKTFDSNNLEIELKDSNCAHELYEYEFYE